MPQTKISFELGRRAIPAVACLVGVSFVLMAGLLVRIAFLQDQHASVQAQTFARAVLDRRREVSAKEIKDYAAWGEAYQHLHIRTDIDWAYNQQNIGRTLYTNLGYDDILVVGPTGKISYAVVAGELAGSNKTPLDGDALDKLVQAARSAGPGESNPSVGYIVANGEPYLVAAAAITAGGDPTIVPQPGLPSILVFADALTSDRLKEIGDLGFLQRLRAEIAPVHSTIQNSMIFDAADEKTRIYFLWTPETPGKTLLLLVLPWLAVGGIAFSILAILILRRAVRMALMIEGNAQALAEAHRHAEHIALHDNVTGLANRILLNNFLEKTLQQIEPPKFIAVLYIDLDRFKLVNDALGHRAGDRMLVETAGRLRMGVREHDLVSRVGGDEFVVILADLDELQEVERVSDRLLELVKTPVDFEESSAQVGLSIGIALARTSAQKAEDVLRAADMAMYQAKTAGGDSYQFFR